MNINNNLEAPQPSGDVTGKFEITDEFFKEMERTSPLPTAEEIALRRNPDEIADPSDQMTKRIDAREKGN